MESSGSSTTTVYRSFSNSWAGRPDADRYPASETAQSQSPAMISRADAINSSSLKRCLDIGVSTALLVILAPVFLLIATAIRVESPGPIFFRQKRYGVQQGVFYIWKFRSMRVLESEGSFRQVVRGDRRVTRVGRFLRKTSLDELPQFYNILCGEMSLVGPRPHAVPMDDTFAAIIPSYADRHLVRPGLTGLAQVEGYRGPTDAVDKIRTRVTLDRLYIRRWSPWLDMAILVKTAWSLSNPNAV